ncbi:MAG: efflux RND transporter permease subunit [Cyanobacteria bacterium REEB67]|nr:efflux RND transporter permease subunit [Cyanobacteria bacterium REEB67]
MWIVELALKAPHTFIVMALSIALFGVLSIKQMAVDIFPNINIPIVSCVWTYTGMSPYNVENLVTTVTERWLTSTVNGIDHIESTSLSGMSIIKVYLHQGTDIGEAVAMVTAMGNAVLDYLPPGITPPFVTVSSATDVPVLQLGITSKTLNEAQLFDIANNFVRNQLATIQGATIPFPYGGKYRQVMIDLDPQAMIANGVSANDVVTAMNTQSIIAPSGTAKMGPYEYIMTLNNTPVKIEELNNIPIKSIKNTVVFVKDVANVHDGYQPQLNIVNEDGRRSVLFNILKNGDASTLAVVQRIKDAMPRLKAIVPPACDISILTDQSIFVRECVADVIREALTAGALTALMMLALLGSWRSTLIVATSIPLAMLCSVIALHITGQTINSMTLGGLALAVGMLVDDATVEVENVHRNMAMGKDIVRAILDGAQQVALPALVSTLSICIVFVPLVFLTEPSKSLFVPLGMAVVFAMLASYGLSRTIVPLMSKALLGAEHHGAGAEEERNQSDREKEQVHKSQNPILAFFSAIHKIIDGAFEGLREIYKHTLEQALNFPALSVGAFLVFYGCSLFLLPLIGQDFFPAIDAGQLRLHVNARPGTRVEETERLYKRIERAITRLIDKGDMELITDNIGMPVSGVNYAFSDSQTISEADGEILVTLKEGRKQSTGSYQKQIRKMLTSDFPEVIYYFQPADIVTQILNAGLPAPIDVRITGLDIAKNLEIAQAIKLEIDKVRGAVDVCLHQVVDAPQFIFAVDRTRANEMGLTQRDVSNSFLISLSSSFQTAPNFWLNNQNGVNYNLAAQTPQYKISSLDDMRITALTSPTTAKKSPSNPLSQPPMLTNVAHYSRAATPAVVNHLNAQPVFDVYAACQERDLGGVSGDIQKILNRYQDKLPRGSLMFIGGQVQSMQSAFAGLIFGLIFALVLVYLLLVVNFQSWKDPLIILMAIPGAFTGILWSLFVTQTTFSIPALMGTIMTVGVASANSILMVTFANEQSAEGYDAYNSALNAGYQRFRPVIMTATAMIIGMIPMAIGSGQGGSQNAPIGRAVIGGLTVATFSTLFFVPLMFSLLRKAKKSKAIIDANKTDGEKSDEI